MRPLSFVTSARALRHLPACIHARTLCARNLLLAPFCAAGAAGAAAAGGQWAGGLWNRPRCRRCHAAPGDHRHTEQQQAAGFGGACSLAANGCGVLAASDEHRHNEQNNLLQLLLLQELS